MQENDGTGGSNSFLVVKSVSVPDCSDISLQPGAHDTHQGPYRTVNVPLMGQIRAGQPNDGDEAFEGIFPLPRHLVGSGHLFLLKVVGDSMIDSAIADGDWVVVRQQSIAEDGEIVAAMIDGDFTIKRLKLVNGKVFLVPDNSSYEAIPGGRATILGRVVAMLRRL